MAGKDDWGTQPLAVGHHALRFHRSIDHGNAGRSRIVGSIGKRRHGHSTQSEVVVFLQQRIAVAAPLEVRHDGCGFKC